MVFTMNDPITVYIISFSVVLLLIIFITRRFIDSVCLTFCLFSNIIMIIVILICYDKNFFSVEGYLVTEGGSLIVLFLYVYWCFTEKRIKTEFQPHQYFIIFSFMAYFYFRLSLFSII